MSDRTPATDKGTADRIEADDGGYWVRLVTKQALKREGACMGNCLDSGDYGSYLVGNEDLVSDGFWSLRKSDGLSYLLVEVDVCGERADIEEALGPKNSQPSGWSCRQLRHLVAAFGAAGATLRIPEHIALTDADGMTWRPDKAPQAVRDAIEARRKAEAEKRRSEYDIPYGQIMARPAGSDEPYRMVTSRRVADGFFRNDPHVRLAVERMVRSVVGDGPINPGVDADDPDATLMFRAGPDEPFQLLRGEERQAAIQEAIRRDIIVRHEVSELGQETVTVRPTGRPDEYASRNEDGTFQVRLGNYVFPKVIPTGEFWSGRAEGMTFRIPPSTNAQPRRAAPRLIGDADSPFHLNVDFNAFASETLSRALHLAGVTPQPWDPLENGWVARLGDRVHVDDAGTVHQATIPAGARDGDIIPFHGSRGERLYNVSVAAADATANHVTVDARLGVFRVAGHRDMETTFSFTAARQDQVRAYLVPEAPGGFVQHRAVPPVRLP